MTLPAPDRIEVIAEVDTMVRPEAISLFLRVAGSAGIGTDAALRKGREVAAIIDLLVRREIPETSLIVHAVTFEAAEGWLSGSSAQIVVELRKLPPDKAPEMIAALSTMKGVAMTKVQHEYGRLHAQRDALLAQGMTECLQQARMIAELAGLPLRSIHELQQLWAEPGKYDGPVAASVYERSRSAAVEPQDVKGFQMLAHHEARLSLRLRMTLRVGEFGETR